MTRLDGWRKALVTLAGLALGSWLRSRGELDGEAVTLIVGTVGAFAAGNGLEHLARRGRDEQPKPRVEGGE